MLTWVRCTLAHRRMHKLRDVFFLRRRGQLLEYWGCRVCRRRWRQRRALSGGVLMSSAWAAMMPSWCVALLTWGLMLLVPILLLSGLLEGPDAGTWEQPY